MTSNLTPKSLASNALLSFLTTCCRQARGEWPGELVFVVGLPVSHFIHRKRAADGISVMVTLLGRCLSFLTLNGNYGACGRYHTAG
jgi:hypothetical protein